ncbi:MAG: hypothetical protein ACE1Y7_04405, partial [Lysobacteraceae bacterium]
FNLTSGVDDIQLNGNTTYYGTYINPLRNITTSTGNGCRATCCAALTAWPPSSTATRATRWKWLSSPTTATPTGACAKPSWEKLSSAPASAWQES